MQSKVGNAQIHEANEQRLAHFCLECCNSCLKLGQTRRTWASITPPMPLASVMRMIPWTQSQPSPYTSHECSLQISFRDQRTHPNTASAAAAQQENSQRVTDPLAPALAHGNEPSRGAKIDAQLQAEDEEMLRKKNA